MPSSNEDQGRADAPPVPSTGRSFTSIDPERVREVVPAADLPDQPPADEAGHDSADAMRGRPANQDGSEGGSGRR